MGDSKFHLICLRCRKSTISISPKLYAYLGYTRCSYCNDCLAKGIELLRKEDREKKVKMNYIDSKAFSSGTEYECFKYEYCEKCKHHKVKEDGFPELADNGGCPIEDEIEYAKLDIERYPYKMIKTVRDCNGQVKKYHHCMFFTERRDYDYK